MSMEWSALFAERVGGMTASEIRELLKLIERPEIISFAGGVPDPNLFPVEALAAAYRRVFQSNLGAGPAFQYSISEGYPPLREWIATQMRAKGIPAATDQILVTNGSQQALDFIGKLLIGPGDLVAVTWPTYLGALQAFSPYQPRYLDIPLDGEGPEVAALEAALARRPKFFYLVPDFQNPTGVTVSEARRRAIVELCTRYQVPVIEDAAYAELRYDGEPVPTLAAIDAEVNGGQATVLYCGTFSKTMVPGMRIGWVSGPKAVTDKLILMKQAADLHTSTINQIVMHDLVSQVYDSHLPVLIATYRERRDAMLQAMAEFFPAGVTWIPPEGGMFIWVDLPAAMDGVALLEKTIREQNAAFVPGAPFYSDRGHRSSLRFTFVTSSVERIREGIRRIGIVLTEEVSKLAAQ